MTTPMLPHPRRGWLIIGAAAALAATTAGCDAIGPEARLRAAWESARRD